MNYEAIDIKGEAASEILAEILFKNKTISEGYVTFEDNVKAGTIFTEVGAEVVQQEYTSGVPTSAGSLEGTDIEVTPKKVMYYHEVDTDPQRFTRFKRTMAAGAWNTISSEFNKLILEGVHASAVSANLEKLFWNNVSTATKAAAPALLTGGSAALVASTTTGLYDGIIQKCLINKHNATEQYQVGGCTIVDGTTITSTNIKGEYEKLYADIRPEVLSGEVTPPNIYVPRSHKQLINIYNNNPANFKNAFEVSADKKKYYYNGLEILFVPVPENVMLAAKVEHVVWTTDLMSDMSQVRIDKIANNREDLFIKSVMTIQPHVRRESFNTLYLG